MKFRVWDIISKAWEREIALTQDGKIIGVWDYDWSSIERTSNYVVQLATGIKDKNGKDIFEGDILKILVRGTILIFSTGTYFAKVHWDEKDLNYKLVRLRENREINSPRFNGALYKDSDRSFEVIGNIFDTPELANEI